MKIKQAFSLAELLIVISLIGVICVFLLGSLDRMMPDKTKVMFKKAYSVTERNVAEIVNDETLYPYDPDKIGFLNTEDVQIPGAPRGTMTKAEIKFCQLFATRLNTLGKTDKRKGEYSKENTCEFETTDGIQWKIPENENFETNGKLEIMVDVNSDNSPNSDKGDDRDRFYINVFSDGRVNVEGDLEVKYLKSHSSHKDR